jgi:signal transduction histidine kinase
MHAPVGAVFTRPHVWWYARPVDDSGDLSAVRARLVADLIGERRRLERVLHDDVQQSLVALAVELQLAAATAPPAAAARLDELRGRVHAALDAVRLVAESVYPPLLDANGLAAALPGIARRAGVRLYLDAAAAVRASPDAEAALLFACRSAFEAAPAGARVAVSLRADGARLRVELEPPPPLPSFARELVEAAGGSVETAGGRLVLAAQSCAAR